MTREILSEIEDVLNRPKFKELCAEANRTPGEMMQTIVMLSHLVNIKAEIIVNCINFRMFSCNLLDKKCQKFINF